MNFYYKCKENEKLIRFFSMSKRRIIDAEIGNSSAVIAYYLLLSIFPLIIALGNILPFLKINPEAILPYIAEMVPQNIYSMLEGTIRSLLENANGGLLSVSAVATVWAASKSINALQATLNKAYGVEKRKNLVFIRLFSFGAVFIFLMMVVFVVVVFTTGQMILDYLLPILKLPGDVVNVFSRWKWPVATLIIFATMFLIYYIIPNARVRFQSVFPGAIFSTISWMMLTQIFGLYTKYFSNGLSSYGVLGSFIVFMLWLNIAAKLIIIGGVINAVNEEYINGEIETKDSMFKKLKKG